MSEAPEKAAVPSLDLGEMERIANAVPEHLIHTGWMREKHPLFGEWFVYADNGRGMGRQQIAVTPANKRYGFTDLSEFIATFDPPMVKAFLARIRALEEGMKAMLDREAERAPSGRPNDCACVSLSRDAEREYETGTCPHQRARALLNQGGERG
jgi:hypothetical protein